MQFRQKRGMQVPRFRFAGPRGKAFRIHNTHLRGSTAFARLPVCISVFGSRAVDSAANQPSGKHGILGYEKPLKGTDT